MSVLQEASIGVGEAFTTAALHAGDTIYMQGDTRAPG